MILWSPEAAFLAFDVGRFLRNLPAGLSVLLVLGILAVIGGAIYVIPRLKELGGYDAASDGRGNLQEKLEKKRQKVLERRQRLADRIPSGPVERNNLPPATLKIRNRVMQLSPGKELTIGKASDNDLVIAELGVSRNHAKIRPERLGYKIYDLVSSHGTFVNGERVADAPLRNDDRIKIGPVELVFNVEVRSS